MPKPTSDMTLTISGMDCASCARTVETGVARLEGVERCELNFSTERLRVSGTITRDQVVQRVRDLGYDVADPQPAAASAAPAAPAPGFFAFLWSRLETRLALACAVLVLPGIVLHEVLGWEAAWIDALALLAMVLTIVPVARGAWRALTINRELTINALMTIAAVGAVVIGAYVEAGLVMVLFAIGEALEGYTATRARHAIKSLMEVVPQTALRLGSDCCPDGCETRVPVVALPLGDVLAIRPV